MKTMTPRPISKMRLPRVAIIVMGVVVLTQLSQQAMAEALVAVSAGTAGEQLDDRGDGPTIASASVNGARGGAAYGAYGTVTGTLGHVAMHAYAYASAPPVNNSDTFLYRANASARVDWSDELRIADTGSLRGGHLGGFLVFQFNPVVHGNSTGPYYETRLSAGFHGFNGIDSSGNSYSTTKVVLGGMVAQDSHSGTIPMSVLLGLDTPDDSPDFTFLLRASLFISVGSNPGDGPNSGPAEADYRNTVSLGPITVSDENGNYVPGSEFIRFVGSSGVEYQVLAVPGPSAWVLAVAGLTTWCGLRRRLSSSRQ